MDDKPLHVLTVAPEPFFTPRGTPFSVYYRALVMSELGARVDILTYGEGADIDLPGVRVFRIPRIPFARRIPTGPSWQKAVLDPVIALWTVWRCLRARYDVIHAHEEAVFFCVPLSRLFRTRLIYDMHSSLPQQLANFGFTDSRLITRAFEWLERVAITRADAVITICPALADYALPLMEDPDRHFLIENSIFEPVRLAEGGATGGETGATPDRPDQGPVIVYAGTLEAYQGIDLLLDALQDLKAEGRTFTAMILGGAPDQVERYRALAADAELSDCVRFTGRVPKQAAEACIAAADVVVSPRTRGNNTPLKVYELLASGKPLVATDIDSHTQVLTREVAFLAAPEAHAFARAIAEALDAREDAEARAHRAAALYERKYSRGVYEAKIRALLDTLRRPRRSRALTAPGAGRSSAGD